MGHGGGECYSESSLPFPLMHSHLLLSNWVVVGWIKWRRNVVVSLHCGEKQVYISK